MPTHVRRDSGRTPVDMQEYDRLQAEGKCPFCRIRDNQANPLEQRIVLQTSQWRVIENISPEEFTLLHVVVFSSVHPDNHRFSGLPSAARYSTEQVLEQIVEHYSTQLGIDLENWDYSMYSRRGCGGVHNALNVFHPCLHVVASDGLEVLESDIPEEFTNLLRQQEELLVNVLRREQSELVAYLEKKYGQSPARLKAELWSEALKFFRRGVELQRCQGDGKAGTIAPKLSNLATEKRTPITA